MLPLRAAFAIDAARLIYARIGEVLRRRGCDPRSGRAVVSTRMKLALLLQAAARGMVRATLVALRVGAGRRALGSRSWT
jgi:phytoene/squalene synthetase